MSQEAFHLIGGHVALDLVNTVDWRADPGRRAELLRGVPDLLAWARRARLATAADARALTAAAARDPRRAARALRRARRLREVLARLYAAAIATARPPGRDVRLLNAFVGSALRYRRLECRGAACAWSWAAGERDAFDALLWPVVLAGAELLASPDRERIRECAGHGCGWLFLDTSRNGRRRWCSMQSCGNRAKARRFYARTRTESAAADA